MISIIIVGIFNKDKYRLDYFSRHIKGYKKEDYSQFSEVIEDLQNYCPLNINFQVVVLLFFWNSL